mmetsp:Transcript_24363/g.67857  ORF Transcript_24363/g.67857 Transcript_24363/m.67857 type:complete len:210 (+) Transcript_24363:52-681(+)
MKCHSCLLVFTSIADVILHARAVTLRPYAQSPNTRKQRKQPMLVEGPPKTLRPGEACHLVEVHDETRYQLHAILRGIVFACVDFLLHGLLAQIAAPLSHVPMHLGFDHHHGAHDLRRYADKSQRRIVTMQHAQVQILHLESIRLADRVVMPRGEEGIRVPIPRGEQDDIWSKGMLHHVTVVVAIVEMNNAILVDVRDPCADLALLTKGR